MTSTVDGARRRRDRPHPLVIAGGAIAIALVVIPMVALVVRAPWSKADEIVSTPGIRSALWLSMRASLSATLVAIVVGTPLAWLLARYEFPGRRAVRAVTTLSLVLPPVVSGVALLLAFGRRGLVGRWLYDWFGVQLPFSFAGVVLAEAFVAMPFLVIALEGAFRSTDRRFEEAAFTLGASRWTAFRKVTLPAVAPSMAAGAVLAWARAVGEFGATITFAGNFPGRTQTMPLAVYLALETDPDAAVLLSLVLVVVSFAVLFGLRSRWVGALGGLT